MFTLHHPNGDFHYKFEKGGYCVKNPKLYIHVYTTFHAMDIRADVQINVLADATIKVILRILSDDVVYYDERANPNLFYGSAILSKQPLNTLWIPT